MTVSRRCWQRRDSAFADAVAGANARLYSLIELERCH